MAAMMLSLLAMPSRELQTNEQWVCGSGVGGGDLCNVVAVGEAAEGVDCYTADWAELDSAELS